MPAPLLFYSGSGASYGAPRPQPLYRCCCQPYMGRKHHSRTDDAAAARTERRLEVEFERNNRRCNCLPWQPHIPGCPEATAPKAPNTKREPKEEPAEPAEPANKRVKVESAEPTSSSKA